MLEIKVTESWREAFPGAHIGMLLVGNIDNSKRPTPLDDLKKKIERELCEKYSGYSRADLLELEELRAYKNYYKKFNKTYHVQLQLESVIHKGKSLPNVNPLVDANFAAELETLLLSAGHDADNLESFAIIDVTKGTEEFTQMNGNRKLLKANDMIMKDAQGVVCSVIYGQDQRTPISPKTTRALYVAYVPPGISAETAHRHLEFIKNHILLFAPEAEVEYQKVFSAD